MNNRTKIIAVVLVAVLAVVAVGLGPILKGLIPDKTNDLTISEPGAEIDGGTYDNIIIADSVGEGNVLLRNVKILGNLIVHGGGPNTVRLENSTVSGAVEISKADGDAPRILAVGSNISQLTATTQAIIETESNGSIGAVTVIGTTLTVKGEETVIDSIVSSGTASLKVAEDATVNTVAHTQGSLTVESSGTVGTVSVEDAEMTVTGEDTVIGTVKTSGEAVVSVSEGASVYLVMQQSGSVTVSGDGNVDSTSITGNCNIDPSTVKTIIIEDEIEENSQIHLEGEVPANVLFNTEKPVKLDYDVQPEISASENITPNIDIVVDVPPHVHSLVPVTDREPTCTVPGTMHYRCSADDGYEIESVTIPATGHSPSAPVREKFIDSTLTEKGYYESVVYCSVCGEEISRTAHFIDRKNADGSVRIDESAILYNIGKTTVRIDNIAVNPDGTTENYYEHLVSLTVGGTTYFGDRLASFLVNFEPTMDNIDGMSFVWDSNGTQWTYEMSVKDGKIYKGDSTTYEGLRDFMSSWDVSTVLSLLGLEYDGYKLSKSDARLSYTGDNFRESSAGVSGAKYYVSWYKVVYPVRYICEGEVIDTQYDYGEVYLNSYYYADDGKSFIVERATMNGKDVPIGNRFAANGPIDVYLMEEKHASVVYVDSKTGEVLKSLEVKVGYEIRIQPRWFDDVGEYVTIGCPVEPLTVPEEGLRYLVDVCYYPKLIYQCDGKVLSSTIIRQTPVTLSFSSTSVQTLRNECYRIIGISEGYSLDTEFEVKTGEIHVNLVKIPSAKLTTMRGEEENTRIVPVGEPITIFSLLPGYDGPSWRVQKVSGDYPLDVPFEMPGEDIMVVYRLAVYANLVYMFDGEEVGKLRREVGQYTELIDYSMDQHTFYLPVNDSGNYGKEKFLMPEEDVIVQTEKVVRITYRQVCDGETIYEMTYYSGHGRITIQSFLNYVDETYHLVSVTPSGTITDEWITVSDQDITAVYERGHVVHVTYVCNGEELFTYTYKENDAGAYIWEFFDRDDTSIYRAVSIPEGFPVNEYFPLPDHDLIVEMELIQKRNLTYVDLEGNVIESMQFLPGYYIVIPDARTIEGKAYVFCYTDYDEPDRRSFDMPDRDVSVYMKNVGIYKIEYVYEGEVILSEFNAEGFSVRIWPEIDVDGIWYVVDAECEDYLIGEQFNMPDHDIRVTLRGEMIPVLYYCDGQLIKSDSVRYSRVYMIEEYIDGSYGLHDYRTTEISGGYPAGSPFNMPAKTITVNMERLYYVAYLLDGDVYSSEYYNVGDKVSVEDLVEVYMDYYIPDRMAGESITIADESYVFELIPVYHLKYLCGQLLDESYLPAGETVELEQYIYEGTARYEFDHINGIELAGSMSFSMPENDVTVVYSICPYKISYFCGEEELWVQFIVPGEMMTIDGVRYGIGVQYVVPSSFTAYPVGEEFPAPTDDIVVEMEMQVPKVFRYVCGERTLFERTYLPGESVYIQSLQILDETGEYRISRDRVPYPVEEDFEMPNEDVIVYFDFYQKHPISYVYDGIVVSSHMIAPGYDVAIPEWVYGSIRGEPIEFGTLSVSDGYTVGETFKMPDHEIQVEVDYRYWTITYMLGEQVIEVFKKPFGEITQLREFIWNSEEEFFYKSISNDHGYELLTDFVMPRENIVVNLVTEHWICYYCGDELINKVERYYVGDERTYPDYASDSEHVYRVSSYPDGYPPCESRVMPDCDLIVQVVRGYKINFVCENEFVDYFVEFVGDSVSYPIGTLLYDSQYRIIAQPEGFCTDSEFIMPDHDLTYIVERIRS